MASTTTTGRMPPPPNGHLPSRPRKLGAARLHDRIRDALTAAATVLTSRQIKRSGPEAWQEESWDLYDEVGELRFVANAVAGAMSQARLYVGYLSEDQRDDPVEVTEGPAVELLTAIGAGPTGRAELVRRIGVQLFVPGDGWLAGLPAGFLESDDEPAAPSGTLDVEGEALLSDLDWHVFSVSEVKLRGDDVEISVGASTTRTIARDRCHLVRVWRPHPRKFWMADSPVRANLPIIRELVGLTKHIAATIDSRLAGAGLLILPEGVSIPGMIGQSGEEDDDSEVDPFLAALMDAMITPISNRESAAAVVPLVATVRDDLAGTIGQNNLIRFDTPFDERAGTLRDEAIRRLALGLDVTPEMLLGMGAVNHWSAWLLDEINAKVHIDPVLRLVCDALTTAYLRPALGELRVADADRYVVWWDLSDLTMRPDRSAEATTGRSMGILSDVAWRRANGFDEADAPPAGTQPLDVAVSTALDLVTAAPSLLQAPGLTEIVRQIREVLTSAPQTAPTAPGPVDTQPSGDVPSGGPGGPPEDSGPPDPNDVP